MNDATRWILSGIATLLMAGGTALGVAAGWAMLQSPPPVPGAEYRAGIPT